MARGKAVAWKGKNRGVVRAAASLNGLMPRLARFARAVYAHAWILCMYVS